MKKLKSLILVLLTLTVGLFAAGPNGLKPLSYNGHLLVNLRKDVELTCTYLGAAKYPGTKGTTYFVAYDSSSYGSSEFMKLIDMRWGRKVHGEYVDGADISWRPLFVDNFLAREVPPFKGTSALSFNQLMRPFDYHFSLYMKEMDKTKGQYSKTYHPTNPDAIEFWDEMSEEYLPSENREVWDDLPGTHVYIMGFTFYNGQLTNVVTGLAQDDANTGTVRYTVAEIPMEEE